VSGDVLATGRKIEVNGDIGEDVIATGTNIIINGDVGKNIKVSGMTTVIGGVIEGDATISAGTLEILPNAKIKGDVDFEGEEVKEGAAILGRTTQLLIQGSLPKPTFLSAFSILEKIIQFLMLLLIGGLFIHFAPVASAKTAEIISTQTTKSFGVGLISLIAFPLGIIVLIITIIGIPLALITFVAYIIGIYVSKIFVGIAIGKKVLERLYNRKSGSSKWSLFMGLLILFILSNTPFLGWLINLVVILIGFGGILLADIKIYREGKNKEII
jgi:cytoskeletal protein CcmA (bactofilin family)